MKYIICLNNIFLCQISELFKIAIQLIIIFSGAKPPKQKCQNYVILKKENKKKASDSNKPILKHFGKVTLNKSNVKRRSEHLHKNKKQKTSIIESYGKVTKNK